MSQLGWYEGGTTILWSLLGATIIIKLDVPEKIVQNVVWGHPVFCENRMFRGSSPICYNFVLSKDLCSTIPPSAEILEVARAVFSAEYQGPCSMFTHKTMSNQIPSGKSFVMRSTWNMILSFSAKWKANLITLPNISSYQFRTDHSIRMEEPRMPWTTVKPWHRSWHWHCTSNSFLFASSAHFTLALNSNI